MREEFAAMTAMRAQETTFITRIPDLTVENYKNKIVLKVAEEKHALARIHSLLTTWMKTGSSTMFTFAQLEEASKLKLQLAAVFDHIMGDATADTSWQKWFFDPAGCLRPVFQEDIVPHQLAALLLEVLTKHKSSWGVSTNKAETLRSEGEESMNALGQDAKRRCVAVINVA
jgi:hypothetical protein